MLPILACGAGIYVGLHFNVLALLPLSVLGAGAYLVSACANGQGLLDGLAVVALSMITVQVCTCDRGSIFGTQSEHHLGNTI